MSESAIRTAIVEVNAELEWLRMNVCSIGNMSVRWNDGMLITPAGCRVETLAPEHIVFTRSTARGTVRCAPPPNMRCTAPSISMRRTQRQRCIPTPIIASPCPRSGSRSQQSTT
jgi:hypothetical protein